VKHVVFTERPGPEGFFGGTPAEEQVASPAPKSFAAAFSSSAVSGRGAISSTPRWVFMLPPKSSVDASFAA
jgi:hypothetical protein